MEGRNEGGRPEKLERVGDADRREKGRKGEKVGGERGLDLDDVVNRGPGMSKEQAKGGKRIWRVEQMKSCRRK